MVTLKRKKLEWSVLELLWEHGGLSARQIQESFPADDLPTDDMVRAAIYHLRSKDLIRFARKIGQTQIFEAVISPAGYRDRLIDDFAHLFAGDMRAVCAHLFDTGRLTSADLETIISGAASARAP